MSWITVAEAEFCQRGSDPDAMSTRSMKPSEKASKSSAGRRMHPLVQRHCRSPLREPPLGSLGKPSFDKVLKAFVAKRAEVRGATRRG